MIPIARKYVGKRQKVKKRKSKAGAIVVLSLLVLMLAALGVCGFMLKHGNTIYPNVTMCGKEIGGMTVGEASKVVQAAIDEQYTTEDLVVTLPDRELTFLASQANVTLDMDYAMERALNYGREGNLISCVFNWLECRKTSYEMSVSAAFSMDTNYVRSMVESVANEVHRTMQDSVAIYDPETRQITVTIGVSGVSLDTERLISTVLDAYSRGDFRRTIFDYDVVLYNPVDLSRYYREYCYPMENAVYDPKTKSVTQEVVGFGFDLEAAQQQVNMAKEGETLVFQIKPIQPEVTKAALEKKLFADLLGEYDSPHTANNDRTTNLILAAAAIDGTILNPGELFSFNGIVGERTKAKGYRPGTIFGDQGASEAATGGGVCQVASAIYVVTLLTDMQIVERTEHMYTVDYVPWGMDATIYWDTNLDFKFRNNREEPILIRTWVEGGFVKVRFYGQDTLDYKVSMDFEILKTYPWKDEYTLDLNKPEGYAYVKTTPYTGYHIVTYKTRTALDGTHISTMVEDESYYTTRNRHTIKGPDPKPVEPEIPVTPEVPETPAEPVTPDTPVTPETPPVPAEPTVEPVDPPAAEEPVTEVPAEPVEPTEPAEPVTP